MMRCRLYEANKQICMFGHILLSMLVKSLIRGIKWLNSRLTVFYDYYFNMFVPVFVYAI